MGTPLTTVQTQIYNVLSSNETLTALVTGVYDGIPENTLFPYVEIGEFTEKPFNTFGRRGKDVTMVVYIYSQYKGNKELFSIRQTIDDILDQKNLVLVNHVLVGMHVIFSETMENDEGDVTKIHIVRYQLWTRETI